MLRYKLVIFDDGKIINQVSFATLAVATEAYEGEKAKGRLADIIDNQKLDRETREKLFPVLAAS